jgi:Mn-dependent DtxR family transcriptional regulator
MDNNHKKVSDKKLILKIPSTILSNNILSLSEKLILSLDYTFNLKKGFNKLSNKQLAQLFNIHSNIVSYCRKSLVDKKLLTKDKSTFKITDKHLENKTEQDQREVHLPFEIYNHSKLKAGAKLLWGEYNSISKGYKEYFAKRSYTANRLNVSEESITNWTKQLEQHQLLKKYELRKGYCKSQKVIITCQFKDGRKILDITHIKNPNGEWVLKRPKMLGFEEWE